MAYFILPQHSTGHRNTGQQETIRIVHNLAVSLALHVSNMNVG
jgi:hypothetical protein